MKKLYELTKEALEVENLWFENIDEETGEVHNTEEIERREFLLKQELVDKSEGIIQVIKNKENLLNGFDEEIKRLQARKKILSNQIDNFKNYVATNMVLMNKNKIETINGNLVIRTTKSVGIDETVLDMNDTRYIVEKITKTPSKTELKKLLEAGEQINGAVIVENKSLNIK